MSSTGECSLAFREFIEPRGVLREGDEDRLRTARATFEVARETPEPESPLVLRDLLLLVGLALGFLLGVAAVAKWSLKRMTR